MAEKADAIGNSALACQRLDRRPLRPFADDDEIDLREARHRLDHQSVALQGDEIADSEKDRLGKAESPPRRVTVNRAEKLEIDPIPQHVHALGRNPESYQPSLQTAGHRDQTVRASRGPANPPARDDIFGDDIQIAAAGGEDDWAGESAPEQHRSDAIRVEIVRIDQIEIPPPAELPAENRKDGTKKGERRHAHPDFRHLRITRMIDMQPVSDLLTW